MSLLLWWVMHQTRKRFVIAPRHCHIAETPKCICARATTHDAWNGEIVSIYCYLLDLTHTFETDIEMDGWNAIVSGVQRYVKLMSKCESLCAHSMSVVASGVFCRAGAFGVWSVCTCRIYIYILASHLYISLHFEGTCCALRTRFKWCCFSFRGHSKHFTSKKHHRNLFVFVN